MYGFDWDDDNSNHIARHHIKTQEAEEVLSGLCVEVEQEPVEGETRILPLGVTAKGRYLSIVYTERVGKIRPITGWDMTKRELEEYVKELSRY